MFAIAVDLGEGTFEASTKALQALKESFREGEILNEVKKIVQDEALKTAGVSVIRLIFSKPFIFICRLMPTTAWVKHTLRRLDQYSKKMPRGIARINTILNDGSVTAKQFSSIKQVVTEHTCCSAFFRDATTKEAYTKMDRIINRTPPAA